MYGVGLVIVSATEYVALLPTTCIWIELHMVRPPKLQANAHKSAAMDPLCYTHHAIEAQPPMARHGCSSIQLVKRPTTSQVTPQQQRQHQQHSAIKYINQPSQPAGGQTGTTTTTMTAVTTPAVQVDTQPLAAPALTPDAQRLSRAAGSVMVLL